MNEFHRSPEPTAARLERRLNEALQDTPDTEAMSDSELLEVMESLAGIHYDIEQRLQALEDAAMQRGLDVPDTEADPEL